MKKTILGFLLGLGIALLLTAFAGENPWNILMILVRSAFGSNYDLGLTLFYTTPLIFCGLSVAWAFRAGMFNIGAEGQMTFACLMMAWFGVVSPNLGTGLSLVAGFLIPLVAGGLWGYLAGWMKARRQAHEVIVTMMLNFVAASIASYVVLNLIPSHSSQNPESEMVKDSFLLKSFDPLKKLFPEAPVSLALILAILLAILSWFIFEKTVFGYRLKMIGLNPKAAERSGISAARTQIVAMTVAGAIAGGVAWAEILGSSGQYKIGFSPDYGFLGIAVALMAQSHPIGILATAFLMGALHKGASDLDMETATITRDFSKVIQGLIVIFVSAPALWTFLNARLKKYKRGHK